MTPLARIRHTAAVCRGVAVWLGLDGPTVAFQDPDTANPPLVVPAPPVDPAVATSGGVPAATPDSDTWPPGRGRHASDCIYLDDPRHHCVTSYGDPIRPGQSCYHSARAETLRHQRHNHPWLQEALGS